jgi:hypothetical protein
LKPNGRPKWIPDLQQTEELASRGMTYQQIAHFFGICEATLYNRLNELPDFLEAIKRGRANGVEKMAGKLFEGGMSGNTTSQLFYLKCIGGWQESGTPIGDLQASNVAESEPVDVNQSRDRALQKLDAMELVLQDKVLQGSDTAIALLLKIQDQRAKLLSLYPEQLAKSWQNLELYGYARSQTEDGYHLRDTTLPPPPPKQPTEGEIEQWREDSDWELEQKRRLGIERSQRTCEVITIPLENDVQENDDWGLGFTPDE